MSDLLQLTRGMTAEERFWFYVDVTPVCWEWTGPVDDWGYGRLWTGERRVHAHRYCYALLVGPIPVGLTLDHLCRVTVCVNPDHLEPVDAIANIMRGYGLPARNARKTHCVNGHPFTPENTSIRSRTGHRTCKACRKQVDKRRYQRQKAQRERDAADPDLRLPWGARVEDVPGVERAGL